MFHIFSSPEAPPEHHSGIQNLLFNLLDGVANLILMKLWIKKQRNGIVPHLQPLLLPMILNNKLKSEDKYATIFYFENMAETMAGAPTGMVDQTRNDRKKEETSLVVLMTEIKDEEKNILLPPTAPDLYGSIAMCKMDTLKKQRRWCFMVKSKTLALVQLGASGNNKTY